MPARLKSLELQGYKTFANRTRFEFGERITAIVGPNGSGKSNIADALRWALGEQAYSALRARRTEDLIFAGSEQRPRAGMAQVTVIFDNSDGWLPVDFTEVAITRRAYRDGDNEYLLNGQRVRLRDVNELLARAGLADRTYTFIAQGVVDASLALRPEDRRAMFEEAAGIGLYRARREEALRRLETTRRNLDRVQDILAELAPRLRSLERQAQRAREYQQVRADLQLMLRDWYGYHWHRTQRLLLDARRVAAAQEERLQQARQKASRLSEQVGQERKRLHTLRQQISAWHRELAERHAGREEQSKALAVAQERVRAAQTRLRELALEADRLAAEERLQAERVAQAQAEVAAHEQRLAETRQALEQAEAALEARRRERRALQQALDETRRRLEKLNRTEAGWQARQEALQSEIQRAEAERDQMEAALERLTAEERQAQERLSQARTRHQQAEAALRQAQTAVEEGQQAVQAAEKALRAAQRRQADLEAQIARLRARLEVLEQAEQALSGYAEGTRLLLEAVRQGRARGGRAPLGPHLHVPAEFETAIAAALDRLADAVLWEGDPEEALQVLQQAPARAAVIPLDNLRPPQPLTPPNDPDCLGVAAQLVSAPAALAPVVQLTLGRVIVARHRAAARRLVRDLPPDALVVTLQGEVFLPSGPVLAGQPGAQGVLRRTRERRELQAELARLEEALAAQQEQVAQAEAQRQQAQATLAQAEEAAQTARQALETAQKQHQEARLTAERLAQRVAWQQKRLAEVRDALVKAQHQLQDLQQRLRHLAAEREAAHQALREKQRALAALSLEEHHAQVNHWRTQVAVAEQTLTHRRARLEEATQALARIHAQQTALEEKRRALEEQVAQGQEEIARRQAALDELDRQLTALRERLEPAEAERQAAETRLAQLEEEETQAAHALRIAERHYTQAQVALNRQEEALETLRRRIEDDLGLVMLEYEAQITGPQPLPLEGLVKRLPVVAEIPPDLEENIRRLRAQLRRLGSINPEAQAEYEEVKQRHEFLSQQMADLKKAEADLRQVITELDELMQQAFQRTFDQVNREFKAIFTRLFGGGTASLVLTNPDDLTQTGVDVVVRLPGKRTQQLAMLSGGERSLTAVALIFALLKASPTPFCVLDEVDAMLDEANVGRFRELLEELSQRTQFVIITHNRNTVQAAQVIYGVTMGEDSVSRVISLKLDEVEDLIRT